jgi:uncharacterized membrane protein
MKASTSIRNIFNILAYALILSGISLSSYLTYLTITTTACPISGGCDLVIASPYSRILGIPVAILGIIGFISILLFLRIKSYVGILFLGIAGILFIAYLQYLQINVIGQICSFCTSAHFLYSLSFIFSLLSMKYSS